jgi:hypothetical protein
VSGALYLPDTPQRGASPLTTTPSFTTTRHFPFLLQEL